MMRSPWAFPLLSGLGVWVAATAVFWPLGHVVVPVADTAAAWAFVLALGGGSLLLGALLGDVQARLLGRTGHDARLRLGVALAAVGLLGDAALMTVAGFAYPALAVERQATLAVFLLYAYGALAVGPLIRLRRDG
ncbi:hypothetical protein [Microtetraspora fusca]|uniref:hypothetical protein n=1 Tax=Microtetraspora fusca TaxID=1997 RepID=UPI000A592536|nr:hypothetical protein [Microtetraspora fusca]